MAEFSTGSVAEITGDNEISEVPEPKVYYIAGEHISTQEDEKEWGCGWSPEVQHQIESIRPQIIIPDSAFPQYSGLYGNPEICIPSAKPFSILPPGETLHLLAADIPIWEEAFPFNQDLTATLRALITDDHRATAVLDEKYSVSTSSRIETTKNDAQEALIVTALVVTTLGLQRFTKEANLSRRSFLKTAGLAGSAYFAGRIGFSGIFAELANANTRQGRVELFDRIAKYVKPVFFRSAWMELRNIKLGLTAHDYARRRQESGKSGGEIRSAIVFGAGHLYETSPSSPEDVLLSQLKKQIESSKDVLLTISDMPREKLIENLKRLLGEYTDYPIPQRDPSHKGDQSGRFPVRPKTYRIKAVDEMIDEVFSEDA